MPEKLFQHQINFEIKETSTDDEYFYFEGYGSTKDIDLVKDIVLPSAFQNSIAEKMPVMLWQHNRDEPIGIYETAEIRNKGLFVRGKMPLDDSFVKGRVIPQLKIKSVKALSIGFYTKVAEYDRETGIRTIKEIDLQEISLVTFPANPNAVITALKSFLNEKTKSQLFPKEFADISHPWDAKEARVRIEDVENYSIDGFLIADKVGEEIKVIPRAVFAVRAMLSGARPDADFIDTEKAKEEVNNLYEKLGMEKPFLKGAIKSFSMTELKNLSKSTLAGVIRHCQISKDAADFLASLFMSGTLGETSDELEELEKLNKSLESLKKSLEQE
jgi:HK97 family phage prohead protease